MAFIRKTKERDCTEEYIVFELIYNMNNHIFRKRICDHARKKTVIFLFLQ